MILLGNYNFMKKLWLQHRTFVVKTRLYTFLVSSFSLASFIITLIIILKHYIGFLIIFPSLDHIRIFDVLKITFSYNLLYFWHIRLDWSNFSNFIHWISTVHRSAQLLPVKVVLLSLPFLKLIVHLFELI